MQMGYHLNKLHALTDEIADLTKKFISSSATKAAYTQCLR